MTEYNETQLRITSFKVNTLKQSYEEEFLQTPNNPDTSLQL